ncbi:MAG TPA: nucleotide sugar dehydrogenase [Acetobacteraceae bacterium]|nr:nucleotide sugar dehydrogenase [Acetobacteraceae bacterium]
MQIAVIGLGKLGAPLAAVLASRGHDVMGVDLNPAYVDALNAGRAPVVEPGLQACIDDAGPRLRASTDFARAIPGTDISFVIVPTPSVDGVFTNRYVVDAVRRIGTALRASDRYHVVNITSTVMPGSTGGKIHATLEAASGRVVGETLGLTYNPEFIALGSVVHDLLHPDMLLIGESDRRAGDLLEAAYRITLGTLPPVRRMNWVNAELAKIAVNTFVTTKISYANMLAEICEHLPGADVDVVTGALGEDSRIGRKYLRGALGYGGPCFPRDNVAFARLARHLGVAADIAEATDAINRRQVDRVVALVHRLGGTASPVAVLGLAYKPETPVVEESQGVMIARRLAQAGHAVVVADPLALDGAAAVLGDSVLPAATPEAAIAMAKIVVVATPAAEFAALRPEAFTAEGRRRIVLDCWRVLPPALAEVAEIVHIGRGAPADG